MKITTKPLTKGSPRALRGGVRVMTPEEMRVDMRRLGKTLGSDPKAAVDFLKDAGILNTKGKLAKGYR